MIKNIPLLLLFIFCGILINYSSAFSQQTIGKVGEKVILKNIGNEYIVEYQNNNFNSDNSRQGFTISNKETLDKLYNLLVSEFESMNSGPIEFSLKGGELRIYYIKKFWRNQVEIIYENKESEETGTLTRLTKKEIQKLFGKE